ncbi:hypothetical protein OTU49_011522, partial [Cherax quadricarinatus]
VQLVNGLQMPITVQHAGASKTPATVTVTAGTVSQSPPLIVLTGIMTANNNPITFTSGGASTTTTVVTTNGILNKEDVKPVPVKRTWRRPWKKKKEREKKQPVKKARRMKRKRIVVQKKSIVHIDPRNGPM